MNLEKYITVNEETKEMEFHRQDGFEMSDGYHTFRELYYHRMILFSIICNNYKDKAWKSKQHDDGSMFDGDFIVGLTTPEGNYTYHYKLCYWDMFNVKELERAPKWDGHMPKDIDRLLSLLNEEKAKMKKLTILFKDGTKVYWFNDEYGKWVHNVIVNRLYLYDKEGKTIAVYRTNSIEYVEERELNK